MSDLLQEIAQQFQGQNLSNLSQQLGANEGQTQAAVQTALPMLLGSVAKNASDQGGANLINNILDTDGDGSIMDDVAGFLGSSNNGIGSILTNMVLGGNRGKLENGISNKTGLNQGQASSLLENLMPIIMGMLSQKKQTGGAGNAGIGTGNGGITDILGQLGGASAGGSGSLIDMASRFIDQDGDGPLDEIGGMLGGLFGR